MKKLFTPLALLAACSSPTLSDGRHPTGSQTIAASTSYQTLYAVSADEGVVSRIPADLRGVQELSLDGEPTRIARTEDRIFVTLRARRQVAVLKDTGAGLELETTIQVGAEPFGIVADEAGELIYVASSQSNRVDEIDAGSLEILRSFSVPGEPRWLALHPAGQIYVASVQDGTLSTIKLGNGEVVVGHLPQIERRAVDGSAFNLARRITGDPAVTPDGETVVIPALYVDNVTTVVEPGDEDVGVPVEGGGGGYSGGPEPRMNASVVLAPATGDGDILLGDSEVVRIGDGPSGTPVAIAGYPASVTISPDSSTAFVTIEGAGAVVAFPIAASDEPGIGERLFGAFQGDFKGRTIATVSTGAGPRGIAFTGDDQAFVHAFLDRQVATFRPGEVQVAVFNRQEFQGNFEQGTARRITEVALPSEVAEGRRLFYSTNDSQMSATGSGLSCATCHFDGRNDGLTWQFSRGGRQTPSLAGKVSETAPVRWEADRATVAEDARMTSQGLMGGQSLQDASVAALAAFVDHTRDVDVDLKGQEDPSIGRGQAIFNRPDVACASCHSGPRYTNNQSYPLLGLTAVKTRSLTGIAASAPYFHDGSAATLAEVIDRARDGSMGNTGMLSDAERADLLRFLQSL